MAIFLSARKKGSNFKAKKPMDLSEAHLRPLAYQDKGGFLKTPLGMGQLMKQNSISP